MTKSAVTAIKMLESLPEDLQERVADLLCEIVDDMRDEGKWNRLIHDGKKMQDLAQKAQKEIQAGRVTDMDFDKL